MLIFMGGELRATFKFYGNRFDPEVLIRAAAESNSHPAITALIRMGNYPKVSPNCYRKTPSLLRK